MSVTVGDVQTFTYDDIMQWARINANNNSGVLQDWFEGAAKYGVGEQDALVDYLNSLIDINGSGLHVYANADGTYTGYFMQQTQQNTSVNPINSNLSTISRGTFKQVIGQKFDNVGGVLKRNMVTRPASGGLGANAVYFLGSAVSAWNAVSTGIALGKTIDSALYSANPDYWDSIGLSSLNPETWNTLINNDDSPFAGMFNFILGLDPDTGNSQAYINEDLFAYMAYALKQNSWFATLPDTATIEDTTGIPTKIINAMPLNVYKALTLPIRQNPSQTVTYYFVSGDGYIVPYKDANSNYGGVTAVSNTPFVIHDELNNRNYSSVSTTYNGSFFYYYPISAGSDYLNLGVGGNVIVDGINLTTDTVYTWSFWNIVYNGTVTSGSAVPGVGNDPNATQPDTSTWTDIPSTLQSLQNQYPSTIGSPMVWDMYNDDGTANQTRWVPVPIPDFISDTGNTPISGNQTQTSLDISQIEKTLQDLLTKILQLTEPTPQPDYSPEPQPEPSPNPPIPPNPVPTGGGETPPIPTVTGEASALWSVYNPTQAQVNSFGAWLWSSPFVTNILKLFQNPIEGVISLHKIFATPVTGASANIVVGTLDSDVSSVTVTDQYTYVDCGSVDLYEQFGNVFDYSPFTEVSLYLPFIGIVTLDVADIMRSSIHISYGVDVYTGTCLAMVEVTRDACTVNMYQYSGVCSVEYPLSNVQNSQMLSGILSVAAGVATVATAGAAGAGVSALMGTAGGLAAMGKQHVGRSGGFSGNAGAMGIKKPYLIIQRPQTKVADTFPGLVGYPTNVSGVLNDFSGQVRVTDVHVEGIPATDSELTQIEELLKSGILI